LEQAQLLRERKFEQVDWEHIIEEIEDMSKSEKRALQSFLETLLMHLLMNTSGNNASGDTHMTSLPCSISSPPTKPNISLVSRRLTKSEIDALRQRKKFIADYVQKELSLLLATMDKIA
jgi:hypothetical protein